MRIGKSPRYTAKGFIPYGRHAIDEDDVAAVAEALRADLLTTGPKVEAFERAFAAATDATFAVACSSGTAALHLAMLALDLGPGDSAIVPTLTFVATANVVRMTGAEVIFADVDPESGLVTAKTFDDAFCRSIKAGHSPKAAVPVHLNGQFCDMAALAAWASERGMTLVEDACHALGIPGIGATRYSQLACFSTHPVKAIATGEGGVVTAGDGSVAARMRRLRSHGIEREPALFENRVLGFDGEVANPWYYEMSEIGWNYRIPDILCALGLSQLRKLDHFRSRRMEIASLYDRLLEPLTALIRPVNRLSSLHGWHLYAVLIDFDKLKISRAQLMAALAGRGIGTQVHYIPVHRQPYYRRRYGSLDLPGADAYYARCLSLPIYPTMSDSDVSNVINALGDQITMG